MIESFGRIMFVLVIVVGAGLARADTHEPVGRCPRLWSEYAPVEWPQEGTKHRPPTRLDAITTALLELTLLTAGSRTDISGLQIVVSNETHPDQVVTATAKGPRVEIPLALGRYKLEVTREGRLVSPPRLIEVQGQRLQVRAYVGEPGDCFYRQGPGIIPFEVREDLLAVYFSEQAPARRDLEPALADLFRRTNIALMSKPCERMSGVRAGGHILVFQLPSTGTLTWAEAELRKVVGESARIGFPFTSDPLGTVGQHLVILDGQFIVQLANPDAAPEFEKWRKQANVLPVSLDKLQKRFLRIKFGGRDFEEHLLQIERGLRTGLFKSAEPALIAEIAGATTADEWPSEPAYWDAQYHPSPAPGSGNHFVQHVREAWEAVATTLKDGSRIIGDPSVTVASIDDGIEHGLEMDCNAAPGTTRVRAFDVAKKIDWDDLGYSIQDEWGVRKTHGLGVFGVLSACANNAVEVVGVSPSSRHIAVRRLASDPDEYAQTLLWLAGFESLCKDDAEPDDTCHLFVPGGPPDIINGSHITPWPSGDLPERVVYALDVLTSCGRDGHGIVMVYSAGNMDAAIETFHPLAADSRTLAVGSCGIKDGDVRRAASEWANFTSAYGENLDLCALGEKNLTVLGWCPYAMAGDYCYFHGTSAAAPVVSGTVALMLSAQPLLPWQQVRDILRETADRSRIHPDPGWVNERNPYYGSGLLDTGAAVNAAKQRTPRDSEPKVGFACPAPYVPPTTPGQ